MWRRCQSCIANIALLSLKLVPFVVAGRILHLTIGGTFVGHPHGGMKDAELSNYQEKLSNALLSRPRAVVLNVIDFQSSGSSMLEFFE
ncbi:hypothetical protein VULLAG_LOCUS4302 [Vulpes lagopus]